jgi:exopolysaccharide biosynthesis polyprenyl glycosylphosphotransferase
MLKEHHKIVTTGLKLSDLAVLAIAMPVAMQARDRLLHAAAIPFALERYALTLAATMLLWFAAARMFDVYDVYRTRPVTWELSRLARAMGSVAIAISALGFLAKQQDVSRLFVGLYFALSLALLAANRLVVRFAARALRRRGYNGHIYAVVGTGPLASEVVDNVVAQPEWGYTFAGYVLTDGDEAPAGQPVLGKLAQLGRLLETHVLDEVVFAVPREKLPDIEDAVAVCEELGVSVRICLDVFRYGPSKMSLEEVGGLATLALTRTPSNGMALIAKRAFDVAVSLVTLMLLAPVFALVALAIRFESRGPIFFRQRRVGQNGRAFMMVKFRSMHIDAEARLEALKHFNEAGGPAFKMKNDPRITKVGRFIRRASIDELPQFWNVLRGQMSVVGPRPPLPTEVAQYKRWQRRRLSVKPGITCTWQVSGRSNISFDRWMELDLDYIDNWSLWRDVQIVMKTIPAVLKARGAH